VPAVTLLEATIPHAGLLTQLYRPPADICSEFELEYVQISSSRLQPPSSADKQVSHFRALPTASILLFLKVNTTAAATEVRIQMSSERYHSTTGTAASADHAVCDGLVLFLPADTTARLTALAPQQLAAVAPTDNSSSEYDILVYRAHINLG
jgi:hypothetical protein